MQTAGKPNTRRPTGARSRTSTGPTPGAVPLSTRPTTQVRCVVGAARDLPSTTGDARLLWAQIPAELASTLRANVQPMADYILRGIQVAVPDFAAPASDIENAIRTGVSQGILRCVAQIGATHTADGKWSDLFRALGRYEYEQGRSLDNLHAAYRMGGRAGWRYFSDIATSSGLPSDLLSVGAEAIFATIDEISSLSVEGYAQARAGAAGALERHRSHLLDVLVSDTGATTAAAKSLAAAAAWPLPEHVVVVALEPLDPDDADDSATALALDPAVLRELDGPHPCLLTADPDQHLARLGSRLRGRRAAIGPRVPLTQAAASLRTARRALDLAAAGTLPDAPVLHCDHHLTAMWLAGDPFLLDRLADRVLAPLGRLSDTRRTRLAHTLLAWLQCHGGVIEAAAHLGVHPQTVRYRMQQITDLFHDQLSDPERRFDLEVALRARALGESVAHRQ